MRDLQRLINTEVTGDNTYLTDFDPTSPHSLIVYFKHLISSNIVPDQTRMMLWNRLDKVEQHLEYEILGAMQELFGNLPRIELFARQKTEGWDVWGNEV